MQGHSTHQLTLVGHSAHCLCRAAAPTDFVRTRHTLPSQGHSTHWPCLICACGWPAVKSRDLVPARVNRRQSDTSHSCSLCCRTHKSNAPTGPQRPLFCRDRGSIDTSVTQHPLTPQGCNTRDACSVSPAECSYLRALQRGA